VIGKEEKARYRIGVDMTFESHLVPALNVQDHAISIIEGWLDGFRAGLDGQLEELAPVKLVQPGQMLLHLVRMHPATFDMRYILRFTRQDRRARKIAKISPGGNCADIFPPTSGQVTGYVECCPAEP
jgi:hypothetical protein